MAEGSDSVREEQENKVVRYLARERHVIST